MSIVTPDLLTIAKASNVYTFGAADLLRLHAHFRPSGIFTKDHWYVVWHPSVRHGQSFHTLNHAIVGQTCPMMYDLPAGWNGAALAT